VLPFFLQSHLDQLLEFEMNEAPTVTRKLIEGEERMLVVEKLFGIHFPFMIEPFIYSVAEKMTRGAYDGGFWLFYTLHHCDWQTPGFFMAPPSDQVYQVTCDNFWEGELSADALGIVCTLYCYSHLSFSRDERFGRICADHYHRLRGYMMLEHEEVAAILRAID
jgi:hypothetical protein